MVNKKPKTVTIPPMTAEQNFLYGLTLSELRTICNHRKGVSCYDDQGKFLPKHALVDLIIMEPDNIPTPPPRNRPVPPPRNRPHENYMTPAPYHIYEYDSV